MGEAKGRGGGHQLLALVYDILPLWRKVPESDARGVDGEHFCTYTHTYTHTYDYQSSARSSILDDYQRSECVPFFIKEVNALTIKDKIAEPSLTLRYLSPLSVGRIYAVYVCQPKVLMAAMNS